MTEKILIFKVHSLILKIFHSKTGNNNWGSPFIILLKMLVFGKINQEKNRNNTTKL